MRKAHNLGSDIKITAKEGATEVTFSINVKGLEDKLNMAQYLLDSQIMTDMVPYMPHLTGSFINLTRARSAALAGSGEVVAAAGPYGRYLYYGKVMVDSKTGRGPVYIPGVGPRFKRGATLVATSKNLKYSNPMATPYWFQTAKSKNLNKWVKLVENQLK